MRLFQCAPRGPTHAKKCQTESLQHNSGCHGPMTASDALVPNNRERRAYAMIDPTIDCDSFEGTKRLADEELLARLHKLMRKDRALTARLLVHLGEVDARGLYRDHAYSSMHVYAVEALGLSDAEASLRIRAARLVRKFSRVLTMFEREELHLTAIGLLSKIMSPENHVAVLAQARHATKAEIEQLIARYCPQPDVPSFMRRLADPRPSPAQPVASPTTSMTSLLQAAAPQVSKAAASPVAGSIKNGQRDGASERERHERALQAAPPHTRRDSGPMVTPLDAARAHDDGEVRARRVGPGVSAESDPPLLAAEARTSFRLEHPRLVPFTLLSPGRYKVQFTASEALQNKLQQAQDLLRRKVPSGDLAPIVDRAIDLLIAQLRKQHFAITAKPQRGRGRSTRARRSRYIPAQVRREVAARDQEQCSYVSPEGRRCPERAQLELDHCNRQFARGGEANAANIRLLCAAHNRLEAERDYGRSFIQQRIEAQQSLKASASTNQSSATRPDPLSSDKRSFRAPPVATSQPGSIDRVRASTNQRSDASPGSTSSGKRSFRATPVAHVRVPDRR